MYCTRLIGNTGRINDAKNRHLRTIAQLCRAVSSQLRHISTIGKSMLSSNICSTCSHNMANLGLLAAEIGSGACGTPANFNEFRVLASLLQRRRSSEANQTLHDVWPSPGLLHYMHFRGLLPPDGISPGANSLCVQVLRSSILAALLHGTPAKLCCVVQGMELRKFCRGRHVYSAGRPSRWTSAHVLVVKCNEHEIRMSRL